MLLAPCTLGPIKYRPTWTIAQVGGVHGGPCAVLLPACSRQACSETWENIPRHKLAEQTIAQLLRRLPCRCDECPDQGLVVVVEVATLVVVVPARSVVVVVGTVVVVVDRVVVVVLEVVVLDGATPEVVVVVFGLETSWS